MPIPSDAVTFSQPMDTNDIVDFVLGFRDSAKPILAVGENIASFTLSTTAEATALGLTIMTGLGRDPILVGTDSLRFWLNIDDLFKNNNAFNGTGTDLALTATIVTNNTPTRTYQRTCVVKVKQL